MRNIVIVEALSTGYNYVEDCIQRGYNPVVLEVRMERSPELNALREDYSLMHHQPVFIEECESYEETLELVRGYDPVLVLPGADTGVILATKLSADLGLPGNPVESLDSMTKKDAMHEALKAAGITVDYGYVTGMNQTRIKLARSAGEQA